MPIAVNQLDYIAYHAAYELPHFESYKKELLSLWIIIYSNTSICSVIVATTLATQPILPVPRESNTPAW